MHIQLAKKGTVYNWLCLSFFPNKEKSKSPYGKKRGLSILLILFYFILLDILIRTSILHISWGRQDPAFPHFSSFCLEILQAYGNRVSCTTVKRAPSRERDPETSRQSEGWAIPRKWAEFAGRSRCIDTFICRNQKVDALWTTEWACRYLIWIPLCAQYDASISLRTSIRTLYIHFERVDLDLIHILLSATSLIYINLKKGLTKALENNVLRRVEIVGHFQCPKPSLNFSFI